MTNESQGENSDRPLAGSIRLRGIPLPLSRLTLGTAFFRWEDRESHFALLDAFVGLGGTLIDSARIYGNSEQVLGAWFAARPGVRERVVLLTKCGHGTGEIPFDDFEATVEREILTSMEVLGVREIDLYVLHRDNPKLPVERIVDRLNVEVTAGRVKALGASNWSVQRIEAANTYARNAGLLGFSIASNHLSLARASGPFYPGLVSVDAEAEAWHARTHIPLVPWSSLARGFFSGGYTPAMRERLESIEDPFTRRVLEVYGTGPNFERLRRAEELGRTLARERRTEMSARETSTWFTAPEVALAWLLARPYPVIPVVGPRNPEELRSCLRALSLDLDESECAWLDGA